MPSWAAVKWAENRSAHVHDISANIAAHRASMVFWDVDHRSAGILLRIARRGRRCGRTVPQGRGGHYTTEGVKVGRSGVFRRHIDGSICRRPRQRWTAYGVQEVALKRIDGNARWRARGGRTLLAALL